MKSAGKWAGVWGSYPIPERFAPLVNGTAVYANRREALKATGEFASWLHQQECSACCAFIGRQTRQQKRAQKLQPVTT